MTHALLGAGVAQSATRGERARTAGIIGALAALLPDADALVRSAADPLLALEYHRQFSHSAVMVPALGGLAAVLVYPMLRGRHSALELWGLTSAAVASAILLDACTSYGTALGWPFTEERVALGIVSVVDPIATLALAAFVAAAAVRRSASAAGWGVVALALYLGLGSLQKERAEHVAQVVASDRGHAATALLVRPSFGNIVLWRSVYLADGHFHADALRLGPRSIEVYPGESIPRAVSTDLPVPPGSVQARDVARFTRLSRGYIVVHPEDDDVVGDARYAMLPHEMSPLWGIRLDPDTPGAHAEVVTFRRLTEPMLVTFLDMILGRQHEASPPSYRR